jgi:hypothetical protein
MLERRAIHRDGADPQPLADLTQGDAMEPERIWAVWRSGRKDTGERAASI